MKKIYFAALALALTACVSNEDLNPVDNYGYIDLNVSNDPIVETRAEINGKVWNVTIGETVYTGVEQSFAAGEYPIKVKTHENETYANNTANYPWGEAFYTNMDENGNTNNKVNVVAGQTVDAVADCGRAKNARLNVVFTDNFKAVFSDFSLNISNPRPISYDGSGDKPSYFSAQSDIKFTIKYDYGTSTAIETKEQTISLGDAGTEKILTVTSNTDGNIQVTINTEEFTQSPGTTITFDAATGTIEETPNAQ